MNRQAFSPVSFGISKQVALIGACLTLCASGRAALWQSENWALVSDLEAETGYDSNLTASKDGPGDTYVAAHPYLTLLRRNSSTNLRLNGGAKRTDFLGNKQSGQTDFSVDGLYSYPASDYALPLYRLTGSWLRTSEPNQYLGQRVEYEQTSFAGEGYLGLSGKTGLRGSAAYDAQNYFKSILNRNKRAEVFGGAAYKRTDTTELSLNVGFATGRSKPNDPARTAADVRSKEYYLTAKILGEITPKITGSAYGGIGRVDYTGGYVNQRYLPVAGADLTWGFDPRRTLVLAVYSGARYSPDGVAANETHAFLSFTHVIVNRWQYIARFGPTFSTYRRETTRKDRSWDAGLEFVYNPSDRFKVSLKESFTTQHSSTDIYGFDRSVTSLSATYHF